MKLVQENTNKIVDNHFGTEEVEYYNMKDGPIVV